VKELLLFSTNRVYSIKSKITRSRFSYTRVKCSSASHIIRFLLSRLKQERKRWSVRRLKRFSHAVFRRIRDLSSEENKCLSRESET